MNTKYLYLSFAVVLVVATGLMATSQAQNSRKRQRTEQDTQAQDSRKRQRTEQDTKDAGLLGEGGFLGTGLGASRNQPYARRVPYYKNPNLPQATSNVVTGALDTAGAVLPWNWGRSNRIERRQENRRQALFKQPAPTKGGSGAASF